MRTSTRQLISDLALVALCWAIISITLAYSATAASTLTDKEAGYHPLNVTQSHFGFALQVALTVGVVARMRYAKLSLLCKFTAIFLLGYWLSNLSTVLSETHRAMHRVSGSIISGP